jgi:hypothetical protein
MNHKKVNITIVLIVLLIGVSIWFYIDHMTLIKKISNQTPISIQNDIGQTIAQQETEACTTNFGPNAYLRNASTGFCGCAPGYTAMYLGSQGEQCVDASNVVLIPPKK